MMVGNHNIYILAIFFVNCLGDFQLNFDDDVTLEAKYEIECNFRIKYDNETVKQAVVVCSRQKRILNFAYEFETETYHKITLIGRLYKTGNVRIISTQIEKGNKDGQCCEKKLVNGHKYVLVDDDGVVPSTCSSSCVYERIHEPGPRFCFSEGQGEAEHIIAHKAECLVSQTHIPHNQTGKLGKDLRSSSAGCPPLKDLPKRDNDGYLCFYSWNYKNLGAGGHSVTGCQGTNYYHHNHGRKPATPGRYYPMGTIAVMPGCTLYMFNGDSGFTGDPPKVLPSGYVYANTGGASGSGDYADGPTGYICECEQETISCTPSDGYDTLVTCDNRVGTVDAICTYQYSTGTTHSTETTTESSMSVEIKEMEEAELEGIFKESTSEQFSTGFKWSEASTETFSETTIFTVTDKAPPGKVLVIQQAVGYCGGRKVKTKMIKTIIQESL